MAHTDHEHAPDCDCGEEEEATFDLAMPNLAELPGAGMEYVRDASGKIVAVWDTLTLEGKNGERETVPVTPIRELFSGNGAAPDLSGEPPAEWIPFFAALEVTVLTFCNLEGRDATDEEMEKTFAELRRRPDGREGRLRSYIRAVASLYMKTFPVSQAQYEAVMRRLSRSARTFAYGPTSTNYVTTLRQSLPV